MPANEHASATPQPLSTGSLPPGSPDSTGSDANAPREDIKRYLMVQLEEIPAARAHPEMQDAFRVENTARGRVKLATSPAFSPHISFHYTDTNLGSATTKKCAYYFGDGRQHPVLGPTLRSLPEYGVLITLADLSAF